MPFYLSYPCQSSKSGCDFSDPAAFQGRNFSTLVQPDGALRSVRSLADGKPFLHGKCRHDWDIYEIRSSVPQRETVQRNVLDINTGRNSTVLWHMALSSSSACFDVGLSAIVAGWLKGDVQQLQHVRYHVPKTAANRCGCGTAGLARNSCQFVPRGLRCRVGVYYREMQDWTAAVDSANLIGARANLDMPNR